MHLCPPHSLGAVFYLPPQRGTAAGVRSGLLPPASFFPTTQPGSALIGAALPTPSFNHLAGAVLTFRDRGHQPHLPPTSPWECQDGTHPCPSHTAVSDYLSENNSPRGPFWKHVLREVTVCRDELLLLLLSRFSRVRLCATPVLVHHKNLLRHISTQIHGIKQQLYHIHEFCGMEQREDQFQLCVYGINRAES